MKNFKIKVQSYNSEKDEYQVEKVYIVQRVVRSELDSLVELHKNLLVNYIDKEANIGELIRDNESWDLIRTIASNLNIVGKKEKGFDVEEISDDLEQICRIFITESMNDDGELNIEEGWMPSLLAKLHHLDFPMYIKEAVKKYQEKREKVDVKETEKK
jgi:hypothetical protein